MRKRFLCMIMALCLALTLLPLPSRADYGDPPKVLYSGTCGEHLTWAIYDDYFLRITGTGPMTDYHLIDPSSEASLSTVVIGHSKYIDAPWSPYSSSYGTISIGEGVTTIGNYAFFGCGPNKLSLVLPSTLTAIGDYAFQGTCISSLAIGNNTASIGSGAFMGCAGLQAVAMGSGVKTIGDNAFNNCGSVGDDFALPDGLLTLGAGAFQGCKLPAALEIPASVTSIGQDAFLDSSTLATLTVAAGNTAYSAQDGVLYNKDMSKLLFCPKKNAAFSGKPFAIPDSVREICVRSVYACDGGFTSLAIPDGVTAIDDEAFDWTSFSGGLTIGSGVKSIGARAFANCDGLTGALNVPGNVTAIGESAFYRTGFSSLTLGSGLKSIGDSAFENSPIAGDAVIPDSVTAIGVNMFKDCWMLTGSLTIGNGVKAIPNKAFYFEGFEGTLTLGNAVESIGDEAFYGCEFTGSLIVPDSVATIGASAFREGYSVKTIGTLTLGSGLKSIGEKAFLGRKFTGSLVIPAGVRTIGNEAFEGCYEFDGALTILGGTIGDEAFRNCSGFVGPLTLSSGVGSIGSNAFRDCKKLTGPLAIPSGVKAIGEDTFWGCAFSGSLTIADGVETIGDYAFYGNYGFKGDLVIPDSVTSIGNNAFQNTWFGGHLTLGRGIRIIGGAAFQSVPFGGSIVIPDSVTEIGGGAFKDCHFITSLHLGKNVQTIGSGAFYDCGSLIGPVVVPASVTAIGESAFFDADNVELLYFLGGAPTVTEATVSNSAGDQPSFPKDITIYYASGSGWTTPSWQGYAAYPLTGGSFVGSDGYYGVLSLKMINYIDGKGKSLTGTVTATCGETTAGSLPTSNVVMTIKAADGLNVSFTSAGRYSASIPSTLLGGVSTVELHDSSETAPFAQAVYASHTGVRPYADILHSGIGFEAGSQTEETWFYLDVNWGNGGAGKAYISQTISEADGTEIPTGFSGSYKLSKDFKANKPVYLIMIAENGSRTVKKLRTTVTVPEVDVKVDDGSDSVQMEQQKDDKFLSNYEFALKFLKMVKVKLNIEKDGTFKGTLGITTMQDKTDTDAAYKQIKEDLDKSSVRESLDNFLASDPTSRLTVLDSDFVVQTKLEYVGYCEGYIRWGENGQPVLEFTKIKFGAKVSGEFSKTWQLSVSGVPIYIEGTFKPSCELTLVLSGDSFSQLKPAPANVKADIKLRVAGGLGLESIVSAGVYGEGHTVLSGTIPFDIKTPEVYVEASFGLEAKFFGLSGDVDLLKTDKLYLCGGAETASLASAPDMQSINWLPQQRDYLSAGGAKDTDRSAASLASVDETNTALTANTLRTNVYPYSDVQTAVLSGGKQLLVWTEDPGATVRSESNNRTTLYYSYFNGSAWTDSAPVETTDDGTADFAPLLRVLDGKAYLVWQNASRALTSDDGAVSTAKTMDISAAVFDSDAATPAFTSLGTVGSDHYDGAEDITLINGAPAVVWASNDADDAFGSSGSNTLWRATRSDSGVWTKTALLTGLGYIDKTAASGDNIWFSQVTGTVAAGSAAANSSEIYRWSDGAVKRLTNNATADTKPSVVNGSAVWFADGSVTGEAMDESVPLAETTDNFQYIVSSTGLEAIVYKAAGKTDDSSATGYLPSVLYASFNDGSGFGNPIVLSGNTGYIGSFSASFLADGELCVAASERDPDSAAAGTHGLSTAANIKIYKVWAYSDIAVQSLDYAEETLQAGGTLGITADVLNKGMSNAKIVKFTVKNGDTVLAEQTQAADLRSGSSEKFCLNAKLPDDISSLSSLTVTAEALGFTETSDALKDNTDTLSLRSADLSLEDASVSEDGKTITVLAANRGGAALTGGTVTLYDTDGTTVLGTQTVGALAAGGAQFVTFSGLTSRGAADKVYTLSAAITGAELASENIESNNSETVLLRAAETAETGVLLSGYYVTGKSGFTVIADIGNNMANAVTCAVYAAAYDSAGKMLSVRCLAPAAALAAGDTSTVQAVLGGDATKIAKVCVFALGADQTPLTGKVEIPKTDS